MARRLELRFSDYYCLHHGVFVVAATFDAATNTAQNNGIGTLTQAHVGGATLSHAIFWIFSVSGSVISSVTYGGSAMTLVGTVATDAAGDFLACYVLKNPLGGSRSAVCTYSGNTFSEGGVVTVANGDGTVNIRAGSYSSQVGTGTAPSLSVTSANGDLVIDCVAQLPTTGTPSYSGSGQTQQGGTNIFGTAEATFSTEAATGTPTVMSETLVIGATWAHIAISIPAAGAATRGLFRQTPMNGLGVGGSFFSNPTG